ncbi:MAG: hypothetical protein JWN34_1603, partial [Bryobacterales bacterium]|nr:hypothetical protein [Bryobacterales bacterium]
CPVAGDHVVELRALKLSQGLKKANIQVEANEASEGIERGRFGNVRGEDLLDGTTDIDGTVEKSAVDIEEVIRELRNNSHFKQ